MSTSTLACYNVAAHKPAKSAPKPLPFFGTAAVACLVLGCAWTVDTFIFSASIYPHLDSTSFDTPVIRQTQAVAARSAPLAAHRPAAAYPASQLPVPAMVQSGPRLSFDERFAAAEPQGVAPQPVEAAPRAEATRQVEPPRQAEAAKLAEASRPTGSSPPPARVAAIAPLPTPRTAEAAPAKSALEKSALEKSALEKSAPEKSAAASLRDMARRAKAAVMSIASADKPTIFEKLWGKPPSRGSLLSYASADTNITGSLGSSQNPALEGTEPRYDRSTAVYDISAHTVYLPDGTKLEAHSGFGNKLDDPSSASIRMRGVTPPHLYELKPREALFHGVPALRLNPVGGDDAIYGRSGLLAHTFMLGPNGDSNGCVSFRDYNAFLNAYRNLGIKKLAVVARID